MSDIDIKSLEANFTVWKSERAPMMKKDRAFEYFAIEQMLKDSQLSDEEIRSGMLGSGGDGGVDSMYFFINKVLLQDESTMPDSAVEAELVIAQSKFEAGFSETAVQKITSFVDDLLDYSTPPENFSYLNASAQEAIARFRDGYNAILGQSLSLKVTFLYATKSDSDVHPNVHKRVETLKRHVLERISDAIVTFEFWGCKRLLASARTAANQILPLKSSNVLTTDDGSLICFVTLNEFASFLTDENGSLRSFLLEPNVRAYQGSGNPVNSDIRKTLETSDHAEFWWLNNGITILASSAPIRGNTVSVEQPEIVNGLQTSEEIYEYFHVNPGKKDDRNVLVRIIVETDEPTRNRIIKATNFQTAVAPLSLHATDPIHFDIQDRLKLYGLFYDRRKGYYKYLRKPISEIVSILDVVRSMIAIHMRRPDVARASPQSITQTEKGYLDIFNESYNRDVYPACVLLDRQVEVFLKNETELLRSERTNVRYYMDLIVACELTNTAKPTITQIATLLPLLLTPLDQTLLRVAFDTVYEEYTRQGGGHSVAKGAKLANAVTDYLDSRFSSISLD